MKEPIKVWSELFKILSRSWAIYLGLTLHHFAKLEFSSWQLWAILIPTTLIVTLWKTIDKQ